MLTFSRFTAKYFAILESRKNSVIKTKILFRVFFAYFLRFTANYFANLTFCKNLMLKKEIRFRILFVIFFCNFFSAILKFCIKMQVNNTKILFCSLLCIFTANYFDILEFKKKNNKYRNMISYTFSWFFLQFFFCDSKISYKNSG